MISIIFALFAVGITLLYFYFKDNDKRLPKIHVELKPEERKGYDFSKHKVVPELTLELPSEPKRLQCYNPATAVHLGSVEKMTPQVVEERIALARFAQRKWATSTFSERRSVLRALLEFYSDKKNQEDICRLCVLESGKTMMDAMLGELIPTCEKLRWMIAQGEKILSPDVRGGQGLMTIHKKAFVEYYPLGVIAVFAPYNYSLTNLLNHVISGIFAGNGVVAKVSEYTSWSADYLLRPVGLALESAGYSRDLVQVVTGLVEAGDALCRSKNIDEIIFTGSDRVGKIIMRNASENLTPVILELGGKDVFVICADVAEKEADASWVKNTAMRGTFQNNGQNCIGIERILIEDVNGSYEKMVKIFEDEVKKLRQAVPTTELLNDVDIGAMTLPSNGPRLEKLVQDAVKKGARLLVGGHINKKLLPGNFFEPTLIVDVTDKMDVFHDEVFGPIMCVSKWTSEVQLSSLANCTKFGLGSSVFCLDKSRAKKISDSIEAGMGNINDFGVNYLCQCLPFGGIRHSGFGRFAGEEGLKACCRMKSMTSDRIPGVRTSLPPPFVYPTASNAADVASDLIGFIYEESLGNKTHRLIAFLKGLLSSK